MYSCCSLKNYNINFSVKNFLFIYVYDVNDVFKNDLDNIITLEKLVYDKKDNINIIKYKTIFNNNVNEDFNVIVVFRKGEVVFNNDNKKSD